MFLIFEIKIEIEIVIYIKTNGKVKFSKNKQKNPRDFSKKF